jgi:hypothetical protein
MDMIVQLPKTKAGNDAIVVFVDKLSKMAHFAAIKMTITVPELAKTFFDNVFRLHRMPESIISDCDPKFTSLFWKALFKKMGTKLAMSTAFHPQTDGQTERMNRTLEQMLRNYVNYKMDNWDEQLTGAEFAYNNAKQASTGFTPFKLATGQDPTVPSGLMEDIDDVNVPSTSNFVQEIQENIQRASENLTQAQARQKKYADEQRREEEDFEIGEKVLVSAKNITAENQGRRPTKKLQARYLGPFEILEKISEVNYKLKLPETMRIHPVFHTSLLKKYKENPDEFKTRTQLPPPPVEVDGEEEFEVEKILDKRERRQGRRSTTEYLIKWKGYPEYDATWEPATALQHAAEAIMDFEEDHRGDGLEGGEGVTSCPPTTDDSDGD